MAVVRVVGVGLVVLAIAGCGSAHPVAVGPGSADAVGSVPSSLPQLGALTPTPTAATFASVGPLTAPIPAGTTTLTVTFLAASDSFATAAADVLFRETITDATMIQRVVTQVDGLPQDGGATRGCTGSSVNLRLDFAGPNGLATLDENSACARATLIIAGTPGPLLDSALAWWMEQTLGLKEVLLPNGQPSMQAT
jgi:hypothetical protein